jgi:hypothetical protein
MGVYEQDLPELQSFYTAFAAEIARHDTAICVVPAEMAVPANPNAARVHWRRGQIVDIWVRDFAPLQATTGATAFTKDANTLILESDPAQLRIDLERESELLAAFLAMLDASPEPESPLGQNLRERWYDLFTRERDRNQEIIEVAGG